MRYTHSLRLSVCIYARRRRPLCGLSATSDHTKHCCTRVGFYPVSVDVCSGHRVGMCLLQYCYSAMSHSNTGTETHTHRHAYCHIPTPTHTPSNVHRHALLHPRQGMRCIITAKDHTRANMHKITHTYTQDTISDVTIMLHECSMECYRHTQTHTHTFPFTCLLASKNTHVHTHPQPSLPLVK